MLAELALPHPDIAQRATRIEITRYGHAMAVPVPGTLRRIGLQPLQGAGKALSKSERFGPAHGRLRFAHSDWSGYSVFEEAFSRGHAAGGGDA